MTPPITISVLATMALCMLLWLSNTRAFNVYNPRITSGLENFRQQIFDGNNVKKNYFKRDSVVLSSWLRDTFKSLGLDFFQEKQRFGNQLQDDEGTTGLTGIVIRTATRKYDAQHSKPSSPLYTTKKDTRAQIMIKPEGVEGDYNHYRTTALSSTPDRAVSILTTDVMQHLENAGYTKVQVGDLGENIYVDGVDYKFFEVGKKYKFSNRSNNDGESVIVEITERIEPCGNLCKLSFINDEELPPTERFENCKKFLLYLDQRDGIRGWYAKVIGDGGQVQVGNEVALLTTS